MALSNHLPLPPPQFTYPLFRVSFMSLWHFFVTLAIFPLRCLFHPQRVFSMFFPLFFIPLRPPFIQLCPLAFARTSIFDAFCVWSQVYPTPCFFRLELTTTRTFPWWCPVSPFQSFWEGFCCGILEFSSPISHSCFSPDSALLPDLIFAGAVRSLATRSLVSFFFLPSTAAIFPGSFPGIGISPLGIFNVPLLPELAT